jgi:phosphatidylglycerophosphate synthase
LLLFMPLPAATFTLLALRREEDEMAITIKFGKQQVPWAMAAVRMALGPVMILGARCGWNGLALAGIVAAALVSDIFDGVLARRWGCDTAAVRLFDSMADTVFYVGVAAALWIGRPQVWLSNDGLLAALLTLELMRFGMEFAKFGKPASYHSYLAKAWGLVMATAVVAVFASAHGSGLLSAALGMGIVCDIEGLAMTAILPLWRNDVKTLREALALRREAVGFRPRSAGSNVQFARKATAMLGIGVMAMGLAARNAFAIEPDHAAYGGGTAGIATDTPGKLDATSPTALLFQYKAATGVPAEIALPYAKIRSIESRHDVVRHLGFLPALSVGLVAARQRRYTLTITYSDSSDAVQVAIFQMDEREQTTLQLILKARSPQSCIVMEYANACAVRPAPPISIPHATR